MTELLVGTKKGLFLLEGDPGSGFEIRTREFAGEPVDYATLDARSGRLLATMTSPFYGPKIFYNDDLGGEWMQAEVGALRPPRGAGARPPRAAVHAVPRRRLSLGRRGRELGGDRRWASLGLRLSADGRSRRSRQRVRDPTDGGHGPGDARGAGAGVRD